MEAMKVLNLSITVLNFFFTVLLSLQDSLQYKQFLVLPFIDSSSRSEEKFVKISQNDQEKT